MDTSRARDQLGWTPEHGAHATLDETVEAARAAGTIWRPARSARRSPR